MNKEQLTELFNTDPELLSTYHILAPNSAEVCAEKTLGDMNEANVDIHLVKKNEEIIGFYGIEKNELYNNLTGFFLKPEYRTKENVTELWNKIDENFDKDYYVGVFSKNTRAIEFLSKKTQTKYEHNNVVVFKVGR
jgi:hypothetical protein